MKRSINSENLIVVMAIAIAISLLATACGPGNIKTLRGKSGKETFVTKNEIIPLEQEIPQEEENIEALEQAKELEASESTEKDANPEAAAKATEALAKRVQVARVLTDKNNQVYIQTIVRAEGKSLNVIFTEHDTTETGVVKFKKVIVEERLDNGAKQGIALKSTSYSAKLVVKNEELSTIILQETTTDSNKNSTKAQLQFLAKLNQATAKVESKDENILKLQDSHITVSTYQAYDSNLNRIDSEANKLYLFAFDRTSQNLQIQLYADLSLEKNTAPVVVSKTSDAMKAITAAAYDMSLTAGNAFIDSNTLSMKFVNKSTQEENNLLLELTQLTAVEEDPSQQNEAPATSESNAQAEPAQATGSKTEGAASAQTPAAPTASQKKEEELTPDQIWTEAQTTPVKPQQAPKATAQAKTQAKPKPVTSVSKERATISIIRNGEVATTHQVLPYTRPVDKATINIVKGGKITSTQEVRKPKKQ